MELEETNPDVAFKPEVDRRLRMPEPLLVRLIAVADMHVESPAGLERQFDAFYAKLIGMQRVEGDALVYRTDNFDLYVDVMEPPVVREDYRPVRAEIKSLPDMQLKLIDAEVEHIRRKGLTPGSEALVLQDPAGNWVELTESRIVS